MSNHSATEQATCIYVFFKATETYEELHFVNGVSSPAGVGTQRHGSTFILLFKREETS